MITIDPDKSKVLEFKINISGNTSEPVARLLVPLSEGMNISILGKVHNDAIQVTIPKLRKIYETLKSGTAQLEIIVDGNVFTPWFDQIEFTEQLKVVAEVVSERNIKSNTPSVQIGATLINENNSKDLKKKSFKSNISKSDYL